MVMAAVSLLEENPQPTEQDVRLGLEGNLCRCTGYHNIVRGRARRRRRGGAGMTATESPSTDAASSGVIGQRLLRKEDARLLTGEGRFVDDLQIPGALWMGMVRSPFAHARIGNIDTSAAAAMPGVRHVFTGDDLHGRVDRRRCPARGPSPTT